jgi:glycosyltransferase involved in cell wall biosynthesis
VRVTYVLGHPALGGGTKVVAQHAALLRDAGVDVTVVAQGARPSWLPFHGPYIDSSERQPRVPIQDLVVATFWTTLAPAARWGVGPVAHFCQGYEGRLDYLQSDWPSIDAAYAVRVPTLTVTPDLAAFLDRRFGRPCRVVRPIIDPLFRPSRWARFRRGARRAPWIAISGVFEAAVKDVPAALDAVTRLRAGGRRCRVLRLSPLPQTPAERERLASDRYLCGVRPAAVAESLRACDLTLFTSRAEEGFGLPLLEAMASGVPAVASRIPSTLFMTREAIPLVTAGDADAFADAASALLDNAAEWRRVRRNGIDAARQFDRDVVLPELLAAVRWAAAPDRPDHDAGPAAAGDGGDARGAARTTT